MYLKSINGLTSINSSTTASCCAVRRGLSTKDIDPKEHRDETSRLNDIAHNNTQASHVLASINILGLDVTKVDSHRGESIGSRHPAYTSTMPKNRIVKAPKWLDG